MKKFNDYAEAKNYAEEYLKEGILKKVRESRSSSEMGPSVAGILDALLNRDYNTFKNVYGKAIERYDYTLQRARFYRPSFYYYNQTLLNFVRSNGKTQSRDNLENRAFFLVGDKVVHLLELGQLTVSELEDFSKEEMIPLLSELIYEYAVHTKNFKLARNILEKNFVSKGDAEFIIESDNMMDYYPLLSSPTMVKKVKPRYMKETFANYLRSLNNTSYSDLFPINHEINEEIIKRYKKQIKTATVTMYETTNQIKENHVDIFDILESNPATRKSFLKFENWEDFREFRKLKDKDEARLHEIVINHLNTEHRNGIKKSQFVRVYKKIKQEIDIDVFRLNPKLQTYVLLEEIS